MVCAIATAKSASIPTMVADPGAMNSSGGYVASIAKVTCPVFEIDAGTSAATEATVDCVAIFVVGNVVDVDATVVVVELVDELDEQAAANSATVARVAPMATRVFERLNNM